MKNLVPIVESEKLKCSSAVTREHSLRPQIHDMLQRAAARVPDGMYLLVYEGYRPRSRQIADWNKVMEQLRREHPGESEDQITARCDAWVVNPHKRSSGHQAGAAIDLTICSAGGAELDMGAEVNEFGPLTAFDAPGLSDAARRNRDLLNEIMSAAGFVNYPAEWWHYSYGDKLWAKLLGKPEGEVPFHPIAE